MIPVLAPRHLVACLFAVFALAATADGPSAPSSAALPDSGWDAIEEHAEDLFDRLDSSHAARALSDARRLSRLITELSSRHPGSESQLAPLIADGAGLLAAVQAGDWPKARGYANDITKQALDGRTDRIEPARTVARLDWLGREFLRLHTDRPEGAGAQLAARRETLRTEWSRLKLVFCSRRQNAALCGRVDGLVKILDADGTSPGQISASRDLLERVDDLERAPHA